MGVRGVVCALMMNTVLTLGKKSLTCRRAWVIFAVILLLALFAGLPTVVLVILSAIAGILLDRMDEKKGARS